MTKTNILPDILLRKFNQRKNTKKLILTSANHIDDMKYIQIGGIDQWISIRGEDRNNPVLLFIHGGPASVYSVFSPLLRPWEKFFTIIQWDQRGAGKTFRKNGKERSGEITIDQLAKDGIALTEAICRELKLEKVILVGSSVGSLIGTLMVKERPDLYHAYVGTDQNSADPKHIAYELSIEALQQAKNHKGIEFLKRIGPDKKKWSLKEFDKRNQIVVMAIRNVPNMIMDLMLPCMLSSPMHRFSDILDIFKGMNFSNEQLFVELMHFDYQRLGTKFEVPFFIMHGDQDIITPLENAKDFFQNIEAPYKEFIQIKNAGHLACFARPEQFFEEIQRKVLPRLPKSTVL
jgi:pimeloyl-ACP methyl ester carboxylesterase